MEGMLTSDASNRGWLQRSCRLSKGSVNAFLGAVLIVFLASGCSAPHKATPQQAQVQQVPAGDYRLSPNDLLDFRIFQEQDFDAVIRISGDGTAIFPMIGKIHIAGKTIGEATELLRERYMAGYLANPQVNITVRTYARKVFTVLGQVQSPGTYEIPGGESVSLLEAIGMAGGYTRIANPSKVIVKRTTGGVETVHQLNAKKMARSDTESTFRIMPGDIITVAESIF
jgi:protein involved in polysaccharide export with SLBB domain